jgi:hypothetical protein
MSERRNLATLPPLFFGRLMRIVTGLVALGVIPFVGTDQLGFWGVACLGFLGLSFLISGIMGNPGCELTALPNLALPTAKRVHCLCPLWTPLDSAEHAIKGRSDQPKTAEPK